MRRSVAASLLVLACLASPFPGLAESLCPPEEETIPHLVLTLGGQELAIQLFEDAAPRTLPRIVALAEEGYYDGLVFGYTRPMVEIAITPPSEGEPIRFPMEIDAEALDLHKEKVANPGAAMDLMQEKLFKTYSENRRNGKVTERLKSWIEQWYANGRTAEFLVGVSTQQVNEALGYVYERGLASRPVARGRVILKSASPGLVTPELGILLSDVPDRDGLWMVVGEVTAGFEDAVALSKRPLLGRDSGGWFNPVEPQVIDSLRFHCK